jgi:hydroxypyruvate isomerase
MRTHGLRFDVNCSILFTELPLLERPGAAKAAGLDGVELWWPWDEPVPSDKDADALVTAIADAGVELVSLNFITGDVAAGERGLLSVPKAKGTFRANMPACAELAARAGCTRLNAPYGNRVDPADPRLTAEQDELAIENLLLAARAAAAAGADVLIEPINSVDVPLYPIDTSAKAIALIDTVRAEDTTIGNLKLLADVYHLATMSEDPSAVLARYADRIGHVQVADVPGRGAPGTGTLPFEPLFEQLARQGYAGWTGLEYRPGDPADTTKSFTWLRASAGGGWAWRRSPWRLD